MSKNTGSAPLWAGQNFLTGAGEIRRLLALSDISSQDLVIEIGPGKGHITRELLSCCGKLLAVELDPALCARLAERFAGEPKLSLFRGDFLKMSLPKGKYKVFANIPFSHTTEIIRRLTQAPNPPTAAWLVVELGAAKRFVGAGRENLSSLSLRPFYQARIAAKISRTQFHPAPRVDAALLELCRRSGPDLPLGQCQSYQVFLERAWKRGLNGMLTKKQISTALRLADLPPLARDANLEYVQWLCLFRCWRSMGKHSQ